MPPECDSLSTCNGQEEQVEIQQMLVRLLRDYQLALPYKFPGALEEYRSLEQPASRNLFPDPRGQIDVVSLSEVRSRRIAVRDRQTYPIVIKRLGKFLEERLAIVLHHRLNDQDLAHRSQRGD